MSCKNLKDTVISYIGADTWKDLFSTKEAVAKLIIDCRKFSHIFSDEKSAHDIEKNCPEIVK